MKRLNFLLIALVAVSATSCYDSFEKDYDVTRVYFASQKPLRTLVADTDMSIKVGVAIGGVREVDPDDWATFEIDPSLLEGTGLTLMPQEYYQLADPDRMTVSNTNLAICDVRVTFSDGLYDDEKALGLHYAIPFRLTGHTHDEIATDVNGNLKDYSIVAVKFVSRWHGTYYMKGQVTNLSTGEVSSYGNKDLSRCPTCSFSSLARNKVQRPGFGSSAEAGEAINLTVNDDMSVTVEAGGTIAITEASATLDPEAEGLELAGPQPKFTLSYIYVQDGVQYRVDEELIRRQSPEADLRFEEW